MVQRLLTRENCCDFGYDRNFHRKRQVTFAQFSHQNKDPYTQPSEPILFPKLRIVFVDIPDLLSSMFQRLQRLLPASPNSLTLPHSIHVLAGEY